MAIRDMVLPLRLSRVAGIFSSATILCLTPAASALQAAEMHVAPVLQFFDADVRSWIADPIIIDTLKAHNLANARLTQAEIEALDTAWIRETNEVRHPMIDSALSAPLSLFLKHKEEGAGGRITEVIVMDARGLNAGQSGITSDYWQGDEDKFKKTFATGVDAIFVDQPRADESTQMLQAQVSVTLVDENKVPIGVITVGVNLDQL